MGAPTCGIVCGIGEEQGDVVGGSTADGRARGTHHKALAWWGEGRFIGCGLGCEHGVY